MNNKFNRMIVVQINIDKKNCVKVKIVTLSCKRKFDVVLNLKV